MGTRTTSSLRRAFGRVGARHAAVLAASVGALLLAGCAPGTPLVPTNPSANCSSAAAEVIVLGDSLTFGSQNEICFVNQANGFRTTNFSVGGFSAANWLGDPGAMFVIANSAARVVYVSLGVNDVIKVTRGQATMDQVKGELAQIAANAGDRCVVWQGINEQFDGINGANPGEVLVPVATAAQYNQAIRDYASTHPNVKFADFNAFVRDNSQIRDGIQQDPSKIHPVGSAARTAHALFVTQQFRGQCGV